MLKYLSALFLLILCMPASLAFSHHSYSPYNTDKTKVISGTVVSWRFRAPHPELVIAVDTESDDGELITVEWSFEGMSMMRWRQLDVPTEIAVEGEFIKVKGWPARDGASSMLLSAVTRESGEYIEILDRVRQGNGNR